MGNESNKMTAVEWFIRELEKQGVRYFRLSEKALKMEKKQTIDFADNYVDNCVLPNENMAIPTIMDVPNYYEQTYGGNNGK
jgi:hypothetical protein